MPTNGAGTYTVPGGINPVVPGTVILDTWANPTLADVAQGITDRLDRSGRGSMLAALKLFDGVVALPGLSWASEPTSGLWRPGAGISAFSILGTEVWRTLAAQFAIVLGSAATPAYSFTGDPNTGFYSPGADQLGFATGGVSAGTINAARTWALPAANAAVTLSVAGTLNGSNIQQWVDGTTTTALFSATGLVAFGTTSAHALQLWANNASRIAIGTAGNVTVNAPSSGIALSVNGQGGSAAIQIVTPNATNATLSIRQTAQREWWWYVPASSTSLVLRDVDGAADRVSISATGSVTINTPTSGIPITINGPSNGQATRWQNGTVTGDAITGTSTFEIGTTSVHDFNLFSGNVVRASIRAGGAFVLNAPASGNHAISIAASSFLELANAGSSGYIRFRDGATDRGFVGNGTAILSGGAATDFGVISAAGGLWLGANNTTWLKMFSDGRIAGLALHNNAGSVTGTTNQYVASGTYTPTLTAGSNANTVSVVGTWSWTRVGNVVSVAGQFQSAATAAAGTGTALFATLPIASNLAAATDLLGVFQSTTTGDTNTFQGLSADTAGDRMTANWTANTTSSRIYTVHFQYVVL